MQATVMRGDDDEVTIHHLPTMAGGEHSDDKGDDEGKGNHEDNGE
jgi:hypothetical protein